jgi:hypothetical protein
MIRQPASLAISPSGMPVNSTTAARSELTALMWLGRERHGTFRQFLAEAKEREDDPYRALYVCLKPLWKYLPAGRRRAGQK